MKDPGRFKSSTDQLTIVSHKGRIQKWYEKGTRIPDAQTRLQYFKKGLEMDTEYGAYSFLGIANAFLDQNNIPAASIAIERAKNFNSDLAIIWETYARLHFQDGNFNKAKKALDKAYEFDSENPSVLRLFGEVQQQLGKTESAVWYFNKCVDIDECDDLAWTRIGEIRYSQGDLDGAIIAFKRALEIKTTSIQSWKHLGNTYFENDLEAEALFCYMIAEMQSGEEILEKEEISSNVTPHIIFLNTSSYRGLLREYYCQYCKTQNKTLETEVSRIEIVQDDGREDKFRIQVWLPELINGPLILDSVKNLKILTRLFGKNGPGLLNLLHSL